MATGIIKKLTDKGFGFIKVQDGADLFFHSSGCTVPFDSLKEGDTVSFETGMGPKGPKAENVTPVMASRDGNGAGSNSEASYSMAA